MAEVIRTDLCIQSPAPKRSRDVATLPGWRCRRGLRSTITNRGRPAHVLLSIEHFRRLAGQERSIADLLAMPGVEDLELPLPSHAEPARAADLS